MAKSGAASEAATRVSLEMDASETAAIDRWSAAHHIEDRSEALHRLIHIALDVHDDTDDTHLR